MHRVRLSGTAVGLAAIALFIVTMLSFVACAPGRVSDPRSARIISTFKILPPYKVESVDSYLDGGSSAWVVRGSNWERVRFYWDGAMYPAYERLARLLYSGRVGDKSSPFELGSASESTLIDLLDLCAEFRLGPVDLAVLDTIHSTGNRKRLKEWSVGRGAEAQRAGGVRLFALGLKQQRLRGYWQSADDNALPADTLEARRQRLLRSYSADSLTAQGRK